MSLSRIGRIFLGKRGQTESCVSSAVGFAGGIGSRRPHIHLIRAYQSTRSLQLAVDPYSLCKSPLVLA